MGSVPKLKMACLGILLLASPVLAFNLPTTKDLTKAVQPEQSQPAAPATKSDSDHVVIQKSSRVGKNVIQFAATGMMAGAAVGAVSGKKEDMQTNMLKGAAAGAAAGATAGYIYGTIEAKKMRSRDQAVAKMAYKPEQGTLLKIESVTAAPDAVAKGKQAAFETVYTVLTPNEKDTIKVVMGFGVVLAALDEGNDSYKPGQLQVFQIENGGGTFKVNVPLIDTKDYEPQSYKFIVGVEADGKDKKAFESSAANFNVMPASAELRIKRGQLLQAHRTLQSASVVN
ncbi:MAG: YMGG-like glycine zipper-containing protein [Desulfobacteraceae bacterium]|nr:YMGG-like glycine zipper-containing protein [Desulfobacteraceae bacterium]